MTELRRRTRPGAQAPAPAPAEAPSRMRRFRSGAAAPAKPKDDRNYYGEVVAALQSIAKLDEQADKLIKQKEAQERHVEFLLEKGGLDHVDDGVWQADRKETSSKASTTIDIPKFRKYVGEEKFATVISVSVTDAKSLVAEKEQAKAGIITVKGAKTGEFKTTVTRVKKK